jgi:lipopolysaccharide biosynthesis protein
MNKIAVLLQLYSLDRLPEFDQLLSNLNNVSIFLSTSNKNQHSNTLKDFIKKHQSNIKDTTLHKNYGVDIAPFLQQLKKLNAETYPYFIKLHSKSSFFGTKLHVDWGSILIDSLIGNRYTFDKNYKILQQQHNGMISHRYFTLTENQGNNIQKIKHLCNILNINYDKVSNMGFAAGSMYASKTKLFQKYLQKHIDYLDLLLSNEVGKVNDANTDNGTYSHALERICGYLVHNEEIKIAPSITKNYIIFNNEYRRLHLHITYNGIAYLAEDAHIYGKIIENNDKLMRIKWLHLDNHDFITEYKKISDNKLIRSSTY